MPRTAKGASTSSEELNAQISLPTDDEYHAFQIKTSSKNFSSKRANNKEKCAQTEKQNNKKTTAPKNKCLTDKVMTLADVHRSMMWYRLTLALMQSPNKFQFQSRYSSSQVVCRKSAVHRSAIRSNASSKFLQNYAGKRVRQPRTPNSSAERKFTNLIKLKQYRVKRIVSPSTPTC